MWSNQENRVRKQVKNPCEAMRYAMHSSGINPLAVGLSPCKIAKKTSSQVNLQGVIFAALHGSQRSHNLHKRISTHLLTVLIMCVIVRVEQRKGKEVSL